MIITRLCALSAFAFLLSAISFGLAQELPIPSERPIKQDDTLNSSGAVLKPKEFEAAIKPLRDYACEKRLSDLGIKFRVLPTENGEGACGVAYPIVIDTLANNITVKPDTALNCNAVEALAGWIEKSVIPAVSAYDSDKKLTSISQASTYVCRGRNNQKNVKLSEHATGNAIDIAAFDFSDGSSIKIEPRDRKGSDEEAFQKAVRFGACLHFTTVLGPGSDAFHDDHLHLDVAERRGGYRLCRFPQ